MAENKKPPCRSIVQPEGGLFNAPLKSLFYLIVLMRIPQYSSVSPSFGYRQLMDMRTTNQKHEEIMSYINMRMQGK